MSDYLDDVQAEDPDELRCEIRAKGARIAYGALVAVCRDPKAPAPAKASAGTALLRAAGFFESAEPKPKDALSDYSLKTLERMRDDLERQNAESSPKDAESAQAPSGDKDLFA